MRLLYLLIFLCGFVTALDGDDEDVRNITHASVPRRNVTKWTFQDVVPGLTKKRKNRPMGWTIPLPRDGVFENSMYEVAFFSWRQCPNVYTGKERLLILAKNICPMVWDERCIDEDFDRPTARLRYRCRKWSAFKPGRRQKEVLVVQAPLFKRFLLQKGHANTENCVMAFFFSPSCPFSARFASYYNALPALYPNIYFLAVNASDPVNNRVNSRFGISGTPTTILWVDGMGVARVDEMEDPAVSLPTFLHTFTDSEWRSKISPKVNGTIQVEVDGDRIDYFLLISILTAMITTAYHAVSYTAWGQRAAHRILLRAYA